MPTGSGTGYNYDTFSIGREAGEDLTNRHRFMTLDSNAKAVKAGAGETVIGTNQNAVSSGEDVSIDVKDIIPVEVDASYSAMDRVTPDADGKATAPATGDEVAGILMEDTGADGDVAPVFMQHTGEFSS